MFPGASTAAATALVTVTATSDLSQDDGAPLSASNEDTTTVVLGAVMQVTKAIDIASGEPGATATYTITYTNTGNADAQDFTVTDDLPANMTYTAGSGRWSVLGSDAADALDDPEGDAAQGPDVDNQIEYSVVTNDITAIISNVAPGQSGFITFSVTVDAGTAPQILLNTAEHKIGELGTEFPTNTVPFEVIQQAGVTLDPPTVVASAEAGDTVTFINTLTNTGTGVDTFDITFVNGTGGANLFPEGTTFQLFQEDEQTPMVDSNSNGIPDTGPVAISDTYNVVIKAYLPAGAPAGTAGYSVTKTATSTFDSDVNDPAVDTLTEIIGADIDLTNDDVVDGANVVGQGSDTAGVTNATNPGTTTTFSLFVNNTGPNPDSYNLTHSALLEGWTVSFTRSGTVTSNSGVIQPDAAVEVTATVFVPAGTPPADYNITFTADSPTTDAGDTIVDTVTVNTIRRIEITTNSAAQTFPGGSIVYEHILRNVGNVTEGAGATTPNESSIELSLGDSLDGQGWTSVVYWDENNDGVIDAGDPVIADPSVAGDLHSATSFTGIAAGQSARLLLKVFAPLGAADGAANITTLTATTTGTINTVVAPTAVSNEDVTTVVRGDLMVVKEQSLTDGSGNSDGNWTRSTVLEAAPGEQIIYRITITNIGSTDATDIVLFDRIPAHTSYNDENESSGHFIVDGTQTDVAPATGSFEFNIGTLAPAKSATAYFGVTIDPLD